MKIKNKPKSAAKKRSGKIASLKERIKKGLNNNGIDNIDKDVKLLINNVTDNIKLNKAIVLVILKHFSRLIPLILFIRLAIYGYNILLEKGAITGSP